MKKGIRGFGGVAADGMGWELVVIGMEGTVQDSGSKANSGFASFYRG